jgi:hypothetical protein
MSLDDDLAAWAATVRLRDDEAAVIFQRLVRTPAPVPVAKSRLDSSWWSDFNADFAARLIASTRPARRAA